MKTDYKVGDKVRIIKSTSSINKKGEVGVIVRIDIDGTAIVDAGNGTSGAWSVLEALELIESINDISTEYDNVNPEHYKKGSVEVFDMMVSIYGKDKVEVFCELNAFKYRMRLGSKPDNSVEQEMRKVRWYEAKLKELK